MEQVLSEYRMWLIKTAWRYTKDSGGLLDDLVQEGAIAIWKAWQEWTPDHRVPLHTFLYNKAKWRMQQVANRGTYTGKPSQRGQNYHTSSTVERPVDFQTVTAHADTGGETSSLVDEVMRQTGKLAVRQTDNLMSHHTKEIVDAINTLPVRQRENIYRYFWLDEPNGKSWAWWNAKKHGARDRLRPQLEHLRDLVR